MPRIILTLPCLLALGACAAAPDARPAAPATLAAREPNALAATPADAPSDFTLGLTVYPGTPRGTPQPARYVLEPGRTLRAAPAANTPAPHRSTPPIVRTLTATQTQEIYKAARAGGLFLREHGARVPTPADYAPPPQRRTGTVLISYRVDGRHGSLALPAADPAARAVVEQVAALAWMRP